MKEIDMGGVRMGSAVAALADGFKPDTEFTYEHTFTPEYSLIKHGWSLLQVDDDAWPVIAASPTGSEIAWGGKRRDYQLQDCSPGLQAQEGLAEARRSD